MKFAIHANRLRVAQMLNAKNEMALVHVHAFRNIMVIHIQDAGQNVA